MSLIDRGEWLWTSALLLTGPVCRPVVTRTLAGGLETARLKSTPLWWAPVGAPRSMAQGIGLDSPITFSPRARELVHRAVTGAGTHVQLWPMADVVWRAIDERVGAQAREISADPLERRVAALLIAARELGVLDVAAVHHLLTGPPSRILTSVDELVLRTCGDTMHFAALIFDGEPVPAELP